MAKDWKVEKLRSPEQVFKRILKLSRPTCIVVFGADGDHKDTVFSIFNKRFDEAIHITDINGELTGVPMRDFFKRFFDEKHDVLIKLPGHISCEPKERHAFMENLRDAGTVSLVGVYAKISPKHYVHGEPGQIATINQANFLTAAPPTPEGFDYLITVHERD